MKGSLKPSEARLGELEQMISLVSRASGVRHATWAMRASE